MQTAQPLKQVTLLTVDAQELVIICDGIAVIAAMFSSRPDLQISTIAKALYDLEENFTGEQYSVLFEKIKNAAAALNVLVERTPV
jgi:hypothetical protein